MPQGKVFVISGPSGAGKDTLVRGLLSSYETAAMAVTATTRARREGEREGVDYYFLSDEEFDERLARGAFLEWAWVHGNRYGTLRAEVERVLAAGRDVVLRIDVQGAAAIKRQLPEAVTVFIFPPDMESLEKRLRGRDTEAEDAVERRLSIAKSEIEEGRRLYDHGIVNDELEKALKELFRYYEEESGRKTS
ncbi:MAG: guanylate kinase [Candidatus Geothermincolia bacterium]